jgi:hypothetical protein
VFPACVRFQFYIRPLEIPSHRLFFFYIVKPIVSDSEDFGTDLDPDPAHLSAIGEEKKHFLIHHITDPKFSTGLNKVYWWRVAISMKKIDFYNSLVIWV